VPFVFVEKGWDGGERRLVSREAFENWPHVCSVEGGGEVLKCLDFGFFSGLLEVCFCLFIFREGLGCIGLSADLGGCFHLEVGRADLWGEPGLGMRGYDFERDVSGYCCVECVL